MDRNLEPLRSAARFLVGKDRCRVLVVEDYSDLARLIALLLEHSGFEVRTLHNGTQVLATARSFLPHFILLDIGLPGLDGYQVAELIRQEPDLKEAVIIAISAAGPEARPGLPRRAHFNHHLTKPVTFDALLPLLTRSPG